MKKKIMKLMPKGVNSTLALILLLPLSACIPISEPKYSPDNEIVTLDHSYVMTQKFWSLSDQFIIRDENRQPMYQVRGQFLSIGDKLRFLDMSGREQAFISEQLVSLLKRYRIYRPDGSFAVIRKDIDLFSEKYTIKLPGDDNLVVRGNFWDLEYCFYRNGRLVAVVTKKLMSWKDSYAIRVARGEDDVLILASAVVIDMIKEDEDSERSGRPHRRHGHR